MTHAFRRVACRMVAVLLLAVPLLPVLHADTDASVSGAPADPKARKTFNDAVGWEHKHALLEAVSQYRKANKQAGGACVECLRRAYQDAISAGDYKSAESIARDSLSAADNDVDKATAHFRIGVALQQQGIANRKERCFSESCDEFKSALTLDPTFTTVHYSLGTSLAHLHQDEQARTEFSEFIDKDKLAPGLHGRAARYLQNIDLARARMAPAFAVTTIDGRHVSMDSLAGKVVLIDFWATWCGPCREALPHIRQIARRFEGQPLVVLSISLDKDEDKWRDFVAKNGMTWLQYRDGGFDGPIATLFGVSAIPATFTIDADGVLEDQHVGDADIEGKLKKLIVRASEAAAQKQQAAN